MFSFLPQLLIVLSTVFPSTISVDFRAQNYNPQQGRFLQAGSLGRTHPTRPFYDNAARFYSPLLSRFLQRDPTGYVDGMNLYEAFGSNPIKNTDPMGTEVKIDKVTDVWSSFYLTEGHQPELWHFYEDGEFMGTIPLDATDLVAVNLAQRVKTQTDFNNALGQIATTGRIAGQVVGAFNPIVNVVQAVNPGEDVLTGEKVDSTLGRVLNVAGGVGVALGAAKVVSVANKLDHAIDAGKSLEKIGEAAQDANRLLPGLARINQAGGLPAGVKFEGTVYRGVPTKYVDDAWKIGRHSYYSEGRYSGLGRGGLYASNDLATAQKELIAHGIPLDTRTFVQDDIRVNNLLDLTDPRSRELLGVSLEDITRIDINSGAYTLPQAIGDFARDRYNGIIFPSARVPGKSNIILFEELP